MRDTLPFAPVALRELAAFWRKQLSELDPTSDPGDLRSRLAQVYFQIFNTDPDPSVQTDAAESILSLDDAQPVDADILEKVAEIAKEQGDTDLQRRVLERLAAGEHPEARKRAKERLGEIFEQAGNRRAAVESWRSAAQLWETAQGEQEHARSLYERVLDTAPDDGEAARRLVLLYADLGAWNRVPELMGVVLRTNCDRGSELLLQLVPRALAAEVRDTLVSMIDEAVAWLRPSSERVSGLQRAKAHALAAPPARHAEASETFRALVDALGSEDDLRDYESFIASIPDAYERHGERRWLYQWRAARDPQPAGVLLAWAKEEEAHGESAAALAVYRRLAQIAPQGDRPPVVLQIARLLADLGRSVEAMAALGPVLALVPPFEAGYAMARQLLVDPLVVEQLDRIASEANGVAAAGLFGLLVDARSETATMPEARRRWLRRTIEFPRSATAAHLSAIVQGAIDFPDETALWQEAETVARELGQLDVVVRAYGAVIAAGNIDAALADTLGRRVVALEGDCNVEPSFFVETLQRVLELAPSARWSLDRVKLALGSQARWEELFRLYDRAIEAAASENERAALLDEAAFAARDLTGDAERAIRYFVSIHALRPDDAAASAALERLYERQGRKHDLVELLAERAGRSEGAARHQFQHRIAALRLDLGQVAEASAVVEAMLEDGVPVVDVANLLERLAGHPGQGRAVERLCGHYESVGRMDDAVHLVQAALEQAESPDERARRVHDLVRLRVSAARGAPGVFARVMANFESEVSGRPALAQHVYKAVLVSAIAVLKEAPTDADFQDAADGAWRAVGALKSALLDAGDARRACRLLERAARLPFERDRRRELLEQAVQLCSGAPGDSKQAIRLYGEIFEDYDTHPFAAASLDHFAGLLEAAGEDGKLARLWERQAQHRATAGNGADPGALFLRAAAAWERHGSGDRAVAAYERAAAFGSEASFEALARIYLGRSQWADAVRVLEWLDAHTSEPAGEGHRLRLADAYIGLGRHDRARSCLEEALRAGPTTAVAHEMRSRLLEVYRCESAWGPLASLLWDEGQRSPNLEQKVAFLCEAAAVMQDKLDQPAAAADALELAVSAAPRDSRLHLVLAQLLESLGQWPRAAEVLKECVAIGGEASPKERGLLHQRLARALSRSSDLEGALAHLRVAAGLLPAHAPVLGDLGRVALDAGRLDVAANAYRTLLLVLRNPGAQGGAISRCEVILSLSRIALLKGDELHAASLLDSALDEALDGGEDPVAFERALGEMGRDDLVARTLERRIERTPSLTDRAIALGNLVDFWIGHRGRDPELGARIRQHTETMLRELADERGASGAVWSALWSVLSRLEDLEAAVGRLQQSERLTLLLQGAIATMGPGADRARLRVLLGRTRIATGSSEEAVALLSSALEEDPSQTEASQFVEAARAVGSALELAERRDEAVRLYESILDRRPTQVSTVRMIADRLEALGSQRLADSHELWMSLDPDAARALAPRLVEHRAAQGDAEGLVRALELGLTADPTNRILVDRLARHHEEQADWPAVARVLCRAMDAAPDDRSLLLRVVEAYRKTGATAEALRLLDGAIATKGSEPELLGVRAAARERAGDDDGAVADLLRIGTDARSVDLVIEMLTRIVERSTSSTADAYAIGLVDVLVGAKRLEQAQGALDRLLARNPQHAGALERTAALAAGQGAWDRAADAYGILVRIVVGRELPDPSQLADIGLALADACERAGRAGAAREPLESIVSILPASASLAGRLERICEITADHERLLRLIAARAETAADGPRKSELLLRAANLLVERIGAPARALPFIERARSVVPESIEAGLAWARVQAELGRANEALPVLLEVVSRNRGRRLPALGAIYLEIGKAHLAADDLVEAFDALKAGFAVDPRCTGLALLLGLLAIDLDDCRTAERALVAVAMATAHDSGSSEKLAAADRIKAIYHLAAIADSRGEVAKALRWATAAAREDPSHAGARALLNKLGTRAPLPGAQVR